MATNGGMKFSCGHCDGCPALPLSPEQFANVLKQLAESEKPAERELAQKFVHMEIFVVFCRHHNGAVLAHYKKKDLL